MMLVGDVARCVARLGSRNRGSGGRGRVSMTVIGRRRSHPRAGKERGEDMAAVGKVGGWRLDGQER